MIFKKFLRGFLFTIIMTILGMFLMSKIVRIDLNYITILLLLALSIMCGIIYEKSGIFVSPFISEYKKTR